MALSHLTEKRDSSVKGRAVFNRKPAREWLSEEDSASPAASPESVMLTAMIDAHEKRDAMTSDTPDAFTQAPMEHKDGED